MDNLGLVLALFLFMAIVSIIFGFKLGIDFVESRFTKEMRQKAEEDFKQRYYQLFVVEFDKKVEERAYEIAWEVIEKYEQMREEEDNESSCSS